MIVVIDGPAGSGKSSTARAIAGQLKIQYLDSGALYRATTLVFLNADRNRDLFFELLKETKISFIFKEGIFEVFVDGVDVTQNIREMKVSDNVSEVAAMPTVRVYVNNLMNDAVKSDIYIADGRDLGTAVFPDAALKFFMVADLETRAKRRLKELNDDVSLQDVMDNLASRDNKDSSREADPLQKADDAIEIDTGTFTFQEQVDHICGYIKPLIDQE